MSEGRRRRNGKHNADKQADFPAPPLASRSAGTAGNRQKMVNPAPREQPGMGRSGGQVNKAHGVGKGSSHHLLFTYSYKSHNILWPFVLQTLPRLHNTWIQHLNIINSCASHGLGSCAGGHFFSHVNKRSSKTLKLLTYSQEHHI